MINFFKGILSLFFEVERRRTKRIPCKTRTHFCFMTSDGNDRGEGTITDITNDGFCCDNLHFFRHNPEFVFKVNHELDFYFTLPVNETEKINFEARGRIRSIKTKDRFGHTRRFGIKLTSIKKGNRKKYLDCVNYLNCLYKDNKPYQQF
jgi:hypothetical protein